MSGLHYWLWLWEGCTFWIGSTTVARFLDRNVGCMLAEKGLLVTALVRARDEAHFNMLLLGRRLNLVAAGSCCSSVEIFERLLASRKSDRLQPANRSSRDWTSN